MRPENKHQNENLEKEKLRFDVQAGRGIVDTVLPRLVGPYAPPVVGVGRGDVQRHLPNVNMVAAGEPWLPALPGWNR